MIIVHFKNRLSSEHFACGFGLQFSVHGVWVDCAVDCLHTTTLLALHGNVFENDIVKRQVALEAATAIEMAERTTCTGTVLDLVS